MKRDFSITFSELLSIFLGLFLALYMSGFLKDDDFLKNDKS